MKYIVIAALCAGLGWAPSKGQGAARPRASLVLRFDKPPGAERLNDLLAGLSAELQRPGTKLAVRVCSEGPLPKTLADAAVYPIAVHDHVVRAEKYTPERIHLLRSADCSGGDRAYAATELWTVPEGAPPPPYSESFRACQVSYQQMPPDASIENSRDYTAALSRLARFLRAHPRAIGVVKGFYYPRRRRPLPTVSRSLREARRTLKRSGIPDGRYQIKLETWMNVWAPETPEPAYPAVYAIEVNPSCDQH